MWKRRKVKAGETEERRSSHLSPSQSLFPILISISFNLCGSFITEIGRLFQIFGTTFTAGEWCSNSKTLLELTPLVLILRCKLPILSFDRVLVAGKLSMAQQGIADFFICWR